MHGHRSAVDRGALVGAALAGVFGAAWSLWAASGLTGMAAVAVRAAGVAIGLVIVILASMRGPGSAAREPAAAGAGSVFCSAGYRVTVAVELIALVGGNVTLNATGHRRYVIVWVALVVGAHFLAFARLFWSGFYWLGAALLAAGAIGLLVGATGGSTQRILAVSGLIAAGSLFVAGGSAVLRSDWPRPGGAPDQ